MSSESLKKRKREQQRQDILIVARELLVREGAANFTIRKLAREYGCAAGTLYLYFKDKDYLIAALVEESFDHLMTDLLRPQPELGPLEALESLLRTFIDFGLTNPDHYSFAFLLRRTRNLEEARPRPHRSYDFLVDVVQTCVDESVVAPVDAQLAAQTLWAGIHGITSLLITIPNFPWCDRTELIDRTVTTLLEGLHPTS